MKQLPDRRRSSPGRLPSDIDGDDHRTKCQDCGVSVWQSETVSVWSSFRGRVGVCLDCAGKRVEDFG